MEYIIIKENSSEWNYMWEWLAKHPINENIEDPSTAENNGEIWQYMGSYKEKEKIVHEFRHRNHIITKDICTLSLSSSNLLTEDDIVKKIRL